jgi:hypothetical protein
MCSTPTANPAITNTRNTPDTNFLGEYQGFLCPLIRSKESNPRARVASRGVRKYPTKNHSLAARVSRKPYTADPSNTARIARISGSKELFFGDPMMLGTGGTIKGVVVAPNPV